MPSRKRIRGLAIFLAALWLSTPTSAQEPREVRLTADEFSFRPARIQIASGKWRITVTNRGRFPHGLALVGREEKIAYLESGETKSLTVELSHKDDLIFYCPQPGHRRKGMEGKITVESL